MAFDGLNHRGNPIYPYHAHSNTKATGVVMRNALRTAYAVTRYEMSFIGAQTYKLHITDEGEYMLDNDIIRSTSYVDVAAFRKWIPNDWTHIFVEFQFRAWFRFAALGYMQITLYSGDAPTFTEEEQESDQVTQLDAVQIPSVTTPAAPPPGWGNEMRRMMGKVDLNNSQGNLRQIHVEAYAVDTPGNAQPIFPTLVTAWGLTIG